MVEEGLQEIDVMADPVGIRVSLQTRYFDGPAGPATHIGNKAWRNDKIIILVSSLRVP